MIICSNCKAKLGDGSTVCVVCGKPVGGQRAEDKKQGTPPPQQQQQPQQQQTQPPAQPQQQPGYPAPGTHTPRTSYDVPQQPTQHHYQQQGYQQSNQHGQQYGALPVHPQYQGGPNQCPRCQRYNVVYYYGDGSAYCSSCQYRYYWRPATGVVDQMTRSFDSVF